MADTLPQKTIEHIDDVVEKILRPEPHMDNNIAQLNLVAYLGEFIAPRWTPIRAALLAAPAAPVAGAPMASDPIREAAERLLNEARLHLHEYGNGDSTTADDLTRDILTVANTALANRDDRAALEAEVARLKEIAGRMATTIAWVADGKGAADGMQERAKADLAAWHALAAPAERRGEGNESAWGPPLVSAGCQYCGEPHGVSIPCSRGTDQ